MAYTTQQLKALVTLEARRQGLDPALALAIAQAESAFNPHATGDKGRSIGLFQLQPAAVRDVGGQPQERYNVLSNIRYGIAYLKNRIAREGDENRGISAYNQGIGWREGQYSNPQYVRTVRQYQRQHQQQPTRLARVGRAVSPASAAAASPPGPPGAERTENAMPSQIEITERLRQIRARKQQLQQQMAPPSATPPAPSTPPAAAPSAAPSAPSAPMNPRDAYEIEVIPGGTPPPPAGTAPSPQPGTLGAPFAAPSIPPGPRSPALAQEQAAAAQQPWWQRAATAFGAASPEIATYASDLPQIEQAKAEMSPAERAEMQRLEGASQGGGLSDVGEIVGQIGGSLVLPGLGTAIGGTVGSVGGMTADRLLREGRLPTWKEVATEAAWSAVPEVAESTLRGAVRRIGRGTEGGRRIRFDEAARRARKMPGVFEAQTREQVGQQFDAVRASGLQLDIAPMRQEIQVLGQGKYEDLLGEVQRLDRLHKTGGRYQQIVDNLRNPGGVGQIQAVSVKDLQDLRSRLRVRSEELTSHEARQLIENFQGAVDDAIDAGMARGSVPTGMTVADLHEARRQWARVRAHEDLRTLVERVADTTEDLSMSSFRVKHLANALRRNEGPLARRINRSLDHVPGARADFTRQMDEISTLYQTVELPMAEVFGVWRYPGFAMLRSGISEILLSRPGREVFREAILEGRGRLSLNGFAAAVNAARRESGLAPLVLPGQEDRERSGATTPTTPPAGG